MSNSENVLLTTGVQQSPMATSIKRAKGHNAVSLLALFLSVVLISMLILKAAPAPFFWLGMLWAAGLCVAMGFVPGSWPRAILLNLAVIVCLAAGIEAFCVLHEYTPATFVVPLFVHDGTLGWAPIRSHQARAIKPGPAGLLHGPGDLYLTSLTALTPTVCVWLLPGAKKTWLERCCFSAAHSLSAT